MPILEKEYGSYSLIHGSEKRETGTERETGLPVVRQDNLIYNDNQKRTKSIKHCR